MRRFFLSVVLPTLAFGILSAQSTSNRINYQAVARLADGVPLLEGTQISLRFTITETTTGAAVYQETVTKAVQKFGLFSHNIGDGITTGNFSAINWATRKSLRVEMNSGTGFRDISNEELRAVPFANYAASAATANTSNTTLKIPNPLLESFKITSPGDGLDPTLVLTQTRNNDMSRIRWAQTGNTKFWDMAAYSSTSTNHTLSVLDFWYFNGSLGQSVMQMRGNGRIGLGINNENQFIGRFNIVNDDDGITNPSVTLQTTRPTDYSRIRMKNIAQDGKFWDIASLNAPLRADSRLNFFYLENGLGSNLLSIEGNGTVRVAGSLFQNSDAQLKRDVQPLATVLPILMQINGYKYFWKDVNRGTSAQIGVLAQEVEAFFPELVSKDDDGIKSVNYSGLVPVLISAIKEQQAEIELIKKELNEIKAATKH